MIIALILILPEQHTNANDILTKLGTQQALLDCAEVGWAGCRHACKVSSS